MMVNKYPLIKRQEIDDSATIEYLLYEGSGPTILFLHGTGFLPWTWHPIARRLNNEYRIIAPYFCDHRAAEPEEGGLKWKILADDFCKFCRALDIRKPYLVGHSMGATVITIAASMDPVLQKRMILMEPIFLPEEVYSTNMRVDQHPLASKSIKRRNRWKDREEAREYLKSRVLYKNWNDEMLDIFLNHGMVENRDGSITLACSPRREASIFMGGLHFNPWPVLGGIQCPVLVLEGAESENRAFIDLKRAASLIPGGEYRLIEGVGHPIPMEKPEEIAAIIREFFHSNNF